METRIFLEDIYPNNLLYAVTIRSPAAKGILKHIQFPALPENYSTITAKNIPGENKLEDTSMPVLAYENLSYIGEPVALILGPDKLKLEEFAGECKVIVDEEKPVLSFEDTEEFDDHNEVTRNIEIGDIHQFFESTDKIVKGSYVTGIQDHWYAEPTGAITWYVNEKKPVDISKKEKKNSILNKVIVVRTATQWPYHVKRSVARVLGLDQESVSVEPTPLSLHMDGKLWFPSLIACHASIGTYFTKKPVRLILNREEDFLFSPKRCMSNIDILTSIDDNGKIKAANIDITVNLGAYGVNSDEILDQLCIGCIGNYNIENLELHARAKRTNIPPQGPFSGFGLSQGFFAVERHVSKIADLIGQDPAQWRKNHINSGKNQIAHDALIELTAKSSDYYRKWAAYELLRQNSKGKTPEKGENPRGIGIALGFQGNGLLYHGIDNGRYGVEVTLTTEGILEIKSSISSSEDFNRLWEKVAMKTMSIEPDKIRIITKNSPDSGPSCASRNITVITKLVEKCCLAIQKQRSKSPLPLTVYRSIKPQNGAFLNGFFPPPAGKTMDINGFLKPGGMCAVVEVSIDIVECIPKIRGIWLGVDGGQIISVNRTKRSLTRSSVQALGWAFTECIEYINGILPRDQYQNFLISAPADIPPIHTSFLEENSSETKGIGELPFTCIPAAFLQAVSQAMDFSFQSIPLKRNDIWEMNRLKNLEFAAGVK
jgi:CO/xanthine dehydrogenase Mo-binding subunit